MTDRLGARVRLKEIHRFQAHWKKNRERLGTIARLKLDLDRQDGACLVLWDGKMSLDEYYLHELDLVEA